MNEVRVQLHAIEAVYPSTALAAMRGRERLWLKKVVHPCLHEGMENPYELNGGGGKPAGLIGHDTVR